MIINARVCILNTFFRLYITISEINAQKYLMKNSEIWIENGDKKISYKFHEFLNM